MKEKLIELISNTTDLEQLKIVLLPIHPYDLAEAYDSLSEEDQKKVMSVLPNEELAELLAYISPEISSEILTDLPENVAASIINEMELDDVNDIMDEMDDDDKDSVINLLSDDVKESIEQLSSYEEGTAGAIMNPNFIKLLTGMSVKQAVKEVTKYAPDAETIQTLFVIDNQDILLGTIDLRSLICARMPKSVDDIMLSNFISVTTETINDDITNIVQNYDTIALPVLEDGKIKGIITMDDAFDILTESAEEDYAMLAGLTESEEKDETIFGSFKKRIPWLAILLVLDLFIAIVISRFDAVIEKVTVLTFFQAAVLGLAGNCGTQSLAVSVRKIGLKCFEDRKAIFKQVIKELSSGIVMGLLLGIVSLGMVFLVLNITKEIAINPLYVATVVGIAVCISVTLSNFFGCLLPIIFYKINIDPAVASGPFITTLNDIIAVVTYFGVAMIILSNYL